MLKIKNKIISQKHRPYIIAEMSANHNRSLERALKIVDAAAASGADAIGESSIGPTKQELPSLRYRRSLFVCGDIKKGEKFTIENIKSIRPNAGLHPRYLNDILGKTATMSVDAGIPLSWKLVGK
jgi:pseudaminic acid synthase